jgi:outer membrane protein assembly factor BamB
MPRPKVYRKPAQLAAIRVPAEDLEGRALLVNAGEVGLILAEGRSEQGPLPPGKYALQSLRERLAGKGPIEAVIADSGPLQVNLSFDNLPTSDGLPLDVDGELRVKVGSLTKVATTLLKGRDQLTHAELAAFLHPQVEPAVRRILQTRTLMELNQDIRLKTILDNEMQSELRHSVDWLQLFGLEFVGVCTLSYRGTVQDAQGYRHQFGLLISEAQARAQGLRQLNEVLAEVAQAGEALREKAERLRETAEAGRQVEELLQVQEDVRQQRQARLRELARTLREEGARPEAGAWQQDVGAQVTARAVVSDGTVFVGTHGGQVWAFDLSTGELSWTSEPLGGKIEGGLEVWKNCVAVPCGDGSLVLLDAQSGAVVNRWKLGSEIRAAPLIHGDLAYVATSDGDVVALALGSGRERGRWAVGHPIKAMPLLWGDLLLVASRDSNLYAFDAARRGSEPVWAFKTRNQIHGSPLLDERRQRVCFGSLDGAVYALDRRGQLLWGPVRTEDQIVASCAIAAGRLFAGNGVGKLHALDVETGEPLWDNPCDVKAPIVAGPAVWNDMVFFGANDGHLYCVEATTGEEFWRFRAGKWVQSTPLVTAEGLVLFGANTDEGGCFHATPWYHTRFTQAAQRSEARGECARAGELWLLAGHPEKAVAALRVGGHNVRAAQVAEAEGLYRQAAQGWEVAAQACQARKDECALLYLHAATNWQADHEPTEAQRCRRESARLRNAPLLTVKSLTEPSCIKGDWVTLTIQVANVGYSSAHKVRVHVHGPVQELPVQDLGTIPQNGHKVAKVLVNPSKSGNIHPEILVAYQDARGHVEEPARGEATLTVEHPPTEVKRYYGPVFEIGQDGVIIYRGGGAAGPPTIISSGDTVSIQRGSSGSSLDLKPGSDESDGGDVTG